MTNAGEDYWPADRFMYWKKMYSIAVINADILCMNGEDNHQGELGEDVKRQIKGHCVSMSHTEFL